MKLHKRSCCSTWVPRKINMEFSKDSRNIFFICEEWPFPDKGTLHLFIYTHIYYIYIHVFLDP